MTATITGSMKGLFRHAGVLVGGFLAFCFLTMINSAYSNVLAPIKEELALSYTLSGVLMSSYFIGYTIGHIPWGYLADRIGSRRTMTLGIIGAGTFTVLFGVTSDVWQAVVSRFLTGLLSAGIFVPGVRLISIRFSLQERGTALGFISVGGSVGFILASWLAPLLAIGLGWRGTLVVFGIIGILSSPLIWSTLRVRGVGSSTRIQENHEKETDVFVILRSRSFWILALTHFLRLGSHYVFIAWLPLFLHEEYGLSLLFASVALSVFNFTGMLSSPLGGFVSDRIGEKRILVFSFFILALALAVFTNTKSLPILFISVFIQGWFINFIQSPSFTLVPKLYGVGVAGKISGIHTTFASMGAIALPLLLGYLRDVTFSYNVGWMVLSALFMLGVVINLFLKTHSTSLQPKERSDNQPRIQKFTCQDQNINTNS